MDWMATCAKALPALFPGTCHPWGHQLGHIHPVFRTHVVLNSFKNDLSMSKKSETLKTGVSPHWGGP